MIAETVNLSEPSAAKLGASELVELVLYIGGATENSRLAVLNIKDISERFLAGRCRLAVVDLFQEPEQAGKHEVLAVPMLIRTLPLPVRRIAGKLSNEELVMIGLDLPEYKVPASL